MLLSITMQVSFPPRRCHELPRAHSLLDYLSLRATLCVAVTILPIGQLAAWTSIINAVPQLSLNGKT